MINIEQGSLGTLEKRLFAGFDVFAEDQRGVGHIFAQYRGIAAIFGQDRIE